MGYNNLAMKITILGPQGSGKTTQAHLLAEQLHLPVVDIGEFIRNSFTQVTTENTQAFEMMKKGELVPNDYAANLLKERLSHPDCKNGFILDGYPRTLSQLEIYDPKTDKVIFISVSDEEATKRLKQRGRMDDTDEAIARRLNWYHSKTSKVLEYYKQEGKLIVVPSRKTQEETFSELKKVLEIS